jgi:hypothetical protein
LLQIIKRKDVADDKSKSSGSTMERSAAGSGDRASPVGTPQNEGQITPSAPPVTIGQMLCLISDAETLTSKVSV